MKKEDELFTSVSESLKLISAGADIRTASFYSIRNSRSNDEEYTVPNLITDDMAYKLMEADIRIVIPRWSLSDLIHMEKDRADGALRILMKNKVNEVCVLLKNKNNDK